VYKSQKGEGYGDIDWWREAPPELIRLPNESIYGVKRIGPSTELCGTP